MLKCSLCRDKAVCFVFTPVLSYICILELECLKIHVAWGQTHNFLLCKLDCTATFLYACLRGHKGTVYRGLDWEREEGQLSKLWGPKYRYRILLLATGCHCLNTETQPIHRTSHVSGSVPVYLQSGRWAKGINTAVFLRFLWSWRAKLKTICIFLLQRQPG